MNVRDIYKEEQGDYYDYNQLLESMGEILIKIDDHDYQGDSRVLLEKDNQYGILIFGWGSCSGCDALQACDNLNEVQELYDSLESQITWFSSAQECLEYFESHDWEGDYSWGQKETKQFIKECKEYLNNEEDEGDE